MRIVSVCIALLLIALMTMTWIVSQPLFNEQLTRDPTKNLTVAPPARALTFARTNTIDAPRLLLIINMEGAELSAVDVSAAFNQRLTDPLEALANIGYAALETATMEAPTITVALQDLGLPLTTRYPQIAAGTNFRAHAEEVGVEDGPFLFPKLTEPTAWNANIPARARLDYEVELCAVNLTKYTVAQPARLGYLLCNDYTDRWTLVRDIDLDGPMGLTGFPDGKGGEGMLPIGPFLVVPKDDREFFPDLQLELFVNGKLRQRARAGEMIWAPHEIAAKSIENCNAPYTSQGKTIPLTQCDGIPQGTLLLTGTPAGVLFNVVSLWSAGAYLEAGDEVVTSASFLGVLINTVR